MRSVKIPGYCVFLSKDIEFPDMDFKNGNQRRFKKVTGVRLPPSLP
jgi:hypothetical protein